VGLEVRGKGQRRRESSSTQHAQHSTSACFHLSRRLGACGWSCTRNRRFPMPGSPAGSAWTDLPVGGGPPVADADGLTLDACVVGALDRCLRTLFDSCKQVQDRLALNKVDLSLRLEIGPLPVSQVIGGEKSCFDIPVQPVR
jgi:hypothetical protein